LIRDDMAKKPSAGTRPKMAQKTIVSRILEETNQGHTTRADLYRQIEQEIGPGHRVLSFFTSFFWPVVISDGDADMVEEVLRTTLASAGDKLVLILNSPGGDPLAAERIIVGPPISVFSITDSVVASVLAISSAKG